MARRYSGAWGVLQIHDAGSQRQGADHGGDAASGAAGRQGRCAAEVAGRTVQQQDAEFGLQHLPRRSEEYTSELQSLMRISYAVFCLKKKKKNKHTLQNITIHKTQDNT